ncbi:unnamed protein product [Closterium sp. Naga37s-1]|nr:unnamed protein product [Closterium sp. Naga37s-1]
MRRVPQPPARPSAVAPSFHASPPLPAPPVASDLLAHFQLASCAPRFSISAQEAPTRTLVALPRALAVGRAPSPASAAPTLRDAHAAVVAARAAGVGQARGVFVEEKYADGYFSDGFYEMNLVATNDMDEIYEDPEYGEMGELEELLTKVDESEDSDDMAASVEAAVKQEEEIVITDAAAVNGGDGDDVNTFAAAIVVEDEAVNAKYVGVEAVKGDIMVKGSKANATAKGQVLKEDERVEGYETREVLGVKMPRRSKRHKKISQGLDVKALNYKTHKQRFKVQELQGSVKPT